jgi:hypothetical protein
MRASSVRTTECVLSRADRTEESETVNVAHGPGVRERDASSVINVLHTGPIAS